MTNQEIPMLDLGPELDLLDSELEAAWREVLKSRRFINGPNVAGFEAEVAEFLGVGHAVGVNSGTDALVIGLRALGVGAGDEVITTPFTFFATAEAVSVIGAKPVFVDIDPETFNIDPGLIEQAITDNTRAIIPVHLFGRPLDMDALSPIAESAGLPIFEDVAQAFGAVYERQYLGSYGALGAFSFFPSKNLGAYGDGGLIATDDAQLAETMRKLRAHGGANKYANEMIGYNSRLDELQAAILRIKLRVVTEFNDGRRRVASRYEEALADLSGIVTPGVTDGHVFHQYTIRILGGARDHIRDELSEQGIASAVYYPTPLHLLPVYRSRNETFPHAEQAAVEVLSLPIWPQMTPVTQDRVIEAVVAAAGGGH